VRFYSPFASAPLFAVPEARVQSALLVGADENLYALRSPERDRGNRITRCVPADTNRAQDVRRQAYLHVGRVQRPGRPQCITLFFVWETSSMGIAANMPGAPISMDTAASTQEG